MARDTSTIPVQRRTMLPQPLTVLAVIRAKPLDNSPECWPVVELPKVRDFVGYHVAYDRLWCQHEAPAIGEPARRAAASPSAFRVPDRHCRRCHSQRPRRVARLVDQKPPRFDPEPAMDASGEVLRASGYANFVRFHRDKGSLLRNVPYPMGLAE